MLSIIADACDFGHHRDQRQPEGRAAEASESLARWSVRLLSIRESDAAATVRGAYLASWQGTTLCCDQQ